MNSIVVTAIVSLARAFGQQTIAEGVENAETVEVLREYGVDYAQGYHFGRPAAIESRAERAGHRTGNVADRGVV